MERDYVTSGNGFTGENNSQQGAGNFEEPQNSWDAYTIPDNLMDGDKTQPNQSNNNSSNQNASQNTNSHSHTFVGWITKPINTNSPPNNPSTNG
jgi:hypothetical protein